MPRPVVTVAVEGPTDRAVVERLFDHAGLQLGPVYICGGKRRLDQRLSGYNAAARYAPWLVLRDLDRDADCAPGLRAALLPSSSPLLCFRLAVRAVESWLLADVEAFSSFLKVNVGRLPLAPDLLPNPRQELLRLASSARRREVRVDLLPIPGTTAQVGPGYTARIIEFATAVWRPEVAAHRSPSLAGCLRALSRLRDQI